MRDQIMAIIRDNADTDQINKGTILNEVCDSLDIINMVWEIEDQFDMQICEAEAAKLLNDKTTVGEFIEFVASKIPAGSTGA